MTYPISTIKCLLSRPHFYSEIYSFLNILKENSWVREIKVCKTALRIRIIMCNVSVPLPTGLFNSFLQAIYSYPQAKKKAHYYLKYTFINMTNKILLETSWLPSQNHVFSRNIKIITLVKEKKWVNKNFSVPLLQW